MKKAVVRKNSYYDSVFLMSIGASVKKMDGVSEAVVAMGTAMNLELLRDMQFATPELAGATANDLIVAIDAASDQAASAAEAEVETLLSKKADGGAGATWRPNSTAAALDAFPDANLVVISLPGQYAAREAHRALVAGRHVMMFSDNVNLEQEIALKRFARERGLLMMGPDCGTAVINGTPLCFANVVPRGSIGLVSASGTGLQEVTSLIARAGGGVSQAIGTGGRDLKTEAVGGSTTLTAIEALAADPATSVIVVISKPPAPSVADTVIAALKAAGKPAVVHLLGYRPDADRDGSVRFTTNLEETALLAVALEAGTDPATVAPVDNDLEAIALRETAKVSATQRYLRGYFTGGTLADEALFHLQDAIGGVYSLAGADQQYALADPHVSREHTIVDLGEDVFTVGRPHPMIDPTIRTERMIREVDDSSVAVVLLDCVIGYGSHQDPAGAVAPAVQAMKAAAAERGGYLVAIASVTGTEGDVQKLSAQRAALEAVGAIVMPSNYQAANLALRVMTALRSR